MADFNDYLEKYGSIKSCRKAHVRKMKSLDLPYCSYNAFNRRLRRSGRSLYKAIHTPCRVKKGKHLGLKRWWHRFILLFK